MKMRYSPYALYVSHYGKIWGPQNIQVAIYHAYFHKIISTPIPHYTIRSDHCQLGYLLNFFFLTSLLEYNCFKMVCQFLLQNKVKQLYIYIYPHSPSLLHLPSTLPIPPLQVDTKHRADLPVLCSCFPLAIYFTFSSVYS